MDIPLISMRFVLRKLHDQEGQTDLRRKLRSKLPPAEWLLWQELKNRGLKGLKFRRQHGLGNYILDFYCPKAKLAIELDGPSHDRKKAKIYDKQRDDFTKAFGIKTIRFKNEEVYNDMDKVLQRIRMQLDLKEVSPSQPPP